MKTTRQTDAAEKQKLMGEVRLARLQLAKVESQLVEAKEQARLARQRRKEAKQNARRAKKHARLAKEKVAEVKLALAELENKLAQPNPTRVKRKPRKVSAKKVAVASRRRSLVKAIAVRLPEILKIKTPAVKPGSKRKAGPAGKAAKKTTAVPRDFETSIVLITPEASKPTSQIVEGVEKLFTGETMAEAPAETGVQAGVAPPEQNF